MRRFFALAALLSCDPAATRHHATAPAPAPVTVPAPTPAPTPSPSPTLANPFRQLAGIEYIEITTGGADPTSELPMVIALHGLGDRPDHFKALVADLATPARIILPRAHDPVEDEGFSWFPIRARSNDLAGLSQGIADAGDRLVPFVRELLAARATRGRPIVTGFSQGGMLSFYLAVYHPDLFSAAIPLGGWLPPPLWPSSKPTTKIPIIALHGEADGAVKYGPTKDSTTHLKSLGFDVTLLSWPRVGHAIPPSMRRELHRRLSLALSP